MTRIAAFLPAFLLTACATAPLPPAQPTAPIEPTGPRLRPILSDRGDCIARPIPAEGRSVGRLRFEGGFELEAVSSLFGGLSGLEAVNETRLLAVTDQGALAVIDLSTDETGAPTARCAIMELRGEDGGAFYGKADSDAEDLTLIAPDRIAVSFERSHRVAPFRLDGGEVRQDGPAIDFSGAPAIEDNQSLEALAMLPSGALLAGAETPTLLGSGQAVWRLASLDPAPVGRPPDFRIAAAGSGFALTGLDATPAGGLVVLQRFFSDALGARAAIGWIGPGVADAASRTVRMRDLGRLAGADGLAVDNFEGIAALAGADGRTIVWIVSDDNFSDEQKTLLYRFSFDEGALGSGS